MSDPDLPERMRAVRQTEFGGPDTLTAETVERPTPGPAEVLVRAEAAAVNPIDTYVRAGDVEPAGGLPHTPGSDVAGVVAATGDTVAGFDQDDPVVATGLGIFETGSYAEYVCVPADRLARRPDGLDAKEAAAGAMVFPTAWRALVDRGGLTVGDVALVQGGGGGVGHAGVQIANHAGATVVSTADPSDAERVSELGADRVVDYRTDLCDRLPDEGVSELDVVLETHADEHLAADIELLARGGSVVVIGEGGDITLTPAQSMDAKIADADVRFMSIVASSDDQRRLLETTMPLLADGTFTVEIDRTFSLAEAAAAHRRVESSGTGGKVLLEP